MKLKWKKLCAAALAVTMAMGNLTYGAPLENGRASARALSAAKIEGLYQDIMDESGTEELLKDGLVMHSTFDEGSVTAGQITDVTGNGNNGTVLDRKLSEKRVFPAIDIVKSGTRREDLLLDSEEQEAVDIMRKAINGMRKDDAVENILNMFARTKNNREYINMVKKNRII